MKKNYIVLIAMMVLSFSAACSSGHSNLNIDFSHKQSNFGLAAAVNNNRIYYVSNEHDISGIYSMNLDGSDVRIEIQNPSVTSLQIINGSLYYNGLFRINKEKGSLPNITINDHTIYRFSIMDNKQSVVNHVNKNENVKSFYISNKGYQVISYGAGHEELSLYDSNNNFIDRKETSAHQKTIKFEYKDDDVKKFILVFGDLLVFSKHFDHDYNYYKFAHNEYPFVLDYSSQKQVLKYDDLRHQQDMLKAFCMDDTYIYCSYNEMALILYNTTFNIKSSIIPTGLSKDYNIEYMKRAGDNIYVIAYKWRNTQKRTLPILDEKLFVINRSTLECEELLDLGSNQRIIGIDDNYVIILKDFEIYKQNLNYGELGEMTKICNIPQGFYSQLNTIDYAGDWMFIYKNYTYPDTGQQLLVKANLQSGEVIENKIELNVSDLDRYKEK